MPELSIRVPSTASTLSVAISGTSAQSGALVNIAGASINDAAVVMSTVDCFVIYGSNPTATTSCMPLIANVQYRLYGWNAGDKMAFITAGSAGTVYITPSA